MKKIKKYVSYIKYYYGIISDFANLNKYIFYSSIFLNRLEKILYSDLTDDVILNNIKIAYSDFKIEHLSEDFTAGIDIRNNFQKEGDL